MIGIRHTNKVGEKTRSVTNCSIVEEQSFAITSKLETNITHLLKIFQEIRVGQRWWLH